MNKKFKKALSVLAAFLVTAASLTLDAYRKPSFSADAKTLKEIEQEKKDKQAQIDAKKEELAELEKDISKKSQYEQTLKEEIDLINSKMLLIDTQMTNLIGDISDKEIEIAKLQEQIDSEEIAVQEGLVLFKKRIRTLYIHGNDSLLSALVGASNFYDVLAKIDIIKRISQHDDAMINSLEKDIRALTEHQQDLTASVQALNLKHTEIEHLQDEFQASRTDLNTALTENKSAIESLASKQKYTYLQLEQNNLEMEQIEEEQERIISEAIQKAIEEEQKQKEEEEKKKQEEAAKHTTTTVTTTTTRATTRATTTTVTTTTTAKPVTTTAAPAETDAPAEVIAPAVTTTTTAAPVIETTTQATTVTTVTTTTAAPVTTTTTTAPPPSGSMFAWPAPGYYIISSPFGWRPNPFNPSVGEGHKGIDIIGATPINGASACAAGNGTVIYTATDGWGGGYGNHVIINHGNGYATLYAHLQSVSVSVGQTVSVGQEVGKIGSTGYSTGPHLHFEVRINNTPVDPMPYLP